MCIFKDVGGDELTAVQGANTLEPLAQFTQYPVHKDNAFREFSHPNTGGKGFKPTEGLYFCIGM